MFHFSDFFYQKNKLGCCSPPYNLKAPPTVGEANKKIFFNFSFLIK